MDIDIKVPSIVVSKDHYDDDENAMWNDITTICRILMHQGYEVKIHNDEPSYGIFVIEYLYDPSSHVEWGCDRFVALTEEEHEEIYNRRQSELFGNSEDENESEN